MNETIIEVVVEAWCVSMLMVMPSGACDKTGKSVTFRL